MNKKSLTERDIFRHFEKISEAPDAVERLRKFILDLAVRGKLVEQDPTDESAYRKAAEQGFYLAQNNLWLSFLRGDGLPQDDVQAAIWFRRAAEQPSATRLCRASRG